MDFIQRFIVKNDLELTDDAVIVANGECINCKEDGYYLMTSKDETDNVVELGVVHDNDLCLIHISKENVIELANKIINQLGGK